MEGYTETRFFQMIRIPTEIMKSFVALLGERGTDKGLYINYQKWLRYYLDFCHKYHFSGKDKDSLNQFMKKLHEKNQTVDQQKQAADAITSSITSSGDSVVSAFSRAE